MKAISQNGGTSDRVATREELYQVMDLLETMPAVVEFGGPQNSGVCLNLAANEARTEVPKLWLDRSEEDYKAEAEDTELESVAEIFVDKRGLVN